MTDEPRVSIDEAPAPKRRLPTWGQGILIVGASVVIGLGGCLAALGGATRGGGNDTVFVLGAIAFFSGLLGVVVGGLMFPYGVIKPLLAPSGNR